jgi:hypothetical protein
MKRMQYEREKQKQKNKQKQRLNKMIHTQKQRRNNKKNAPEKKNYLLMKSTNAQKWPGMQCEFCRVKKSNIN